SADSQVKSGDISSEALGAFNREIGDVGNAYIAQVAGGQQVNTAADVSPQSGRTGEFTIFDALFPQSLSGAVNKVANIACPATTSMWSAALLALGNGIVAVIPGFNIAAIEGDAAVDSAEQVVAKSFVDVVTAKIKQQVLTVEGRAAIKNTAKKYASDSVKTGARQEGFTYLARMIVLAEMGQFMSASDSQDFANHADMGAVAYSNQMSQQQLYGRPLTTSEAAAAQQEDGNYVTLQNSRQSTYQKYFALANPKSVFGSLAMKAGSLKLGGIAHFFLDLPHVAANIFSPFNHFFVGHSLAADDAANINYHMVQFGWSPEEERLIDSDSSYDPIVNAQILADSGQSDAIAAKYGKCFTDDIGTMLTNGGVNRDSNGNNADNGLCSSSNLGFKNTVDSFAADNDPRSNQRNDLVFRWRLDQSYQSVQSELNGIQDPGANSDQ
ncbi:MAG TPA: hypothetical protein VHA30_00200, partial [Patescibacteria group bacterium]|nr:hypothetical protein [Patescibacteria group bacterium]